ncbi:hypothetical protein [Marinobacter sp.]|uniref:hypothetical protein n=1 Tax=Marinobacter sp. TaxID=50741 RepID=UPI00384F37B1
MSITYTEAVEFLGLKKTWNSNSFPWKSKNREGMAPTLESIFTLKDNHGVMEDVLVILRHKSSSIPGIPNSFNAVLLLNKQRLVSLDENGSRKHTNRVGVGMPYFGHTLTHPHLHVPVPDSMDGYAEPIDTRNVQEMWQIFLTRSGIIGAPALQLPTSEQLELSF